jgi:lambda repressor-like predicted transcriptional regulator
MSKAMLHSTNLWNTIDKIAAKEGLSLPRLALKAGLDQSTFSHARRQRNWPSMQTIARVLNVTKISPVEWARLIDLKEKDNHKYQ